MELSISDEKTKKDLIYDILLEALEEVGLTNAISEGRKNELVSEDFIVSE